MTFDQFALLYCAAGFAWLVVRLPSVLRGVRNLLNPGAANYDFLPPKLREAKASTGRLRQLLEDALALGCPPVLVPVVLTLLLVLVSIQVWALWPVAIWRFLRRRAS